MNIRKNYSTLSAAERQKFVAALHKVKRSNVIDDFAELHASHFSHGIHRSAHFLPWHRELLLRFERELQKHEPSVTLPYWDSTKDVSPADPLWRNDFLGQFDAAWGLGRQLGGANLATAGEVADAVENLSSYGDFWRTVEVDIHNPPHRWVGGVMASAASPGDPVFYLHHGWIDLLWARWRGKRPNAPFVASGPGTGLNDPFMGWADRRPADVLDHVALGYRYDEEALVA